MKSQKSWPKRLVYNLREFFWPLLDKVEPIDNTQHTSNEFQLIISGDNLDQAVALKSKMYDGEEDRRKSIESKASLFISTISLATSIVVAANSLIINNINYSIIIKVSVALSFILSIYAARTVWFAVKALERGNYSVLGLSDINIKGTKQDYQKHLIECYFRMNRANESIINAKVNYATMAQEYYKRAIIVISIYAFTVLCFCLLK